MFAKYFAAVSILPDIAICCVIGKDLNSPALIR